ncbi:MAG: carboxypeptidase regulatory-like domain-containing protein [Endomicrobia bacterium]|nr:carboxypeptidase regulatory-like domain-containing protein [Endomicrobiia bacterium]
MKLLIFSLLIFNYFLYLYSDEGDIIWKSTITPTNPASTNGGSGITILGEQVFISGLIDTDLTSQPLQLNGVIAGYNILDGKVTLPSVRLTNIAPLDISPLQTQNRLLISGVTISGFFLPTPRLYLASINPTNGTTARSYTHNTPSYGSKNIPFTENQIYVAANIVQNLDSGYFLFNNQLQSQQQNIYQTSTEEYAYDIKVSTNQNVYIIGKQRNTDTGYDIFLLRMHGQLTQPQPLRIDYNKGDDIGGAIYLTNTNQIYAVGYITISTSPFQAGLWVMKYNEDLTPAWSNPFIKPLLIDATNFTGYFVTNIVALCDIEQAERDNIYIIYNDVKNSTPTANLIKIDKDGNLLLEKNYPLRIFAAMAVDSLKNIYVTGTSFESNNVEIATWKIEGPSPKGFLTGTVISKDEAKPLAGAVIEVLKGDTIIAQTTAGSDGKYHLKISTGVYVVKASSFGYISEFSPQIYIEENSTSTVNFLLERVNFGFLEGTVLSEEAQPIPNATIIALQNQVIVSSTTTQQDGSYLMSLDVGTYDIKVTAFGYLTQIATSVVIIPAQTTTKNFILKRIPVGYLVGKVLDEQAQPIVGAVIEVFYNSVVVTSKTVDQNGDYSITIPTGTYEVKASSEGFISKISSVTIIENSTTTLNFVLKKIPKGTLRGFVLSSDGEPINLATINIYSQQQLISTTYTNDIGFYEVILPTGVYKVEATASNYQPKIEENVIIYESSITYKNFILQRIPKGYITGTIRVRNIGTPIPGAIIILFQNSQIISNTTATQDGSYFMEVSPGMYDITVSSDGYITFYSTGIIITEGRTLTLDVALEKIKIGTLKGVVLDSETSQPIEGVILNLKVYNLLVTSTTTDASGSYQFIHHIGTYTVEAIYEGYRKQSKTALIIENSTVTLNFILNPVYFIEGKILTSDNQPLSGVNVILICLTDGTTSQTVTNNEGLYRFSELIKADYKIYPQKEGWEFQPQEYTYLRLNSNKTSQNFTAYLQQTITPPQEKISLPIGEVTVPKKDELKIVTSNPLGKISSEDKIYIVFDSIEFKEYKLKIITPLGDKVYESKKVAYNPYEFFEYYPKDLPSGTYIIILEKENSKITKKFSLTK